jgi:integrase
MALRKRDIDALRWDPAGSATQITWDKDGDGTAEALAGFGVQLFATGRKSYVVQYRVGRKSRRMSLGSTSKRTVDQAREEARKILVRALSGEDAAEARQRKPVDTFATFAKDYIEKHAKPHKRSWPEDQRRIDKHLKPRWGRRTLDAVSRADVSKLHAEMGKATKHEANQVLALVSVIYAKAKDWGSVPESFPNPAHSIKPFAVRSRERWLKPEEAQRLLQALHHEGNVFYRSAIRLYLLLAVRRSELLRLRWDDVNLSTGDIVFPETKANRPHDLPLSDVAVSIFTELAEHRVKDNPFVFPSPTLEGGHMHDLKGPWRRLRKRARLEDVRLHDLRRTVGSWAGQDGASLHVISMIMNHSDIKTTRIYARESREAKARELDKQAARVIALDDWRERKGA